MSDETAMRAAKRPRTTLAGPYGHPFHAFVITIPIGSWIAGFVFDVTSVFADDAEVFTRGALLLVGIGLLGALAAAVLGFLDYSKIAPRTRVRKIATTHMVLNLSVIVLFTISFIIRLGQDFGEANIAAFVFSIIALLLLSASGVLGGELSYRYGVRVADEDTQVAGYR